MRHGQLISIKSIVSDWCRPMKRKDSYESIGISLYDKWRHRLCLRVRIGGILTIQKLLCRMYTREESSLIRQEFWTTFGKYMSPIPSAEGLKVNWVNYKTGIKDVHFRMEALVDSAAICISIERGDAGIRELYFEQFLELKIVLHNTLEEEWEWQPDVVVNGKMTS